MGAVGGHFQQPAIAVLPFSALAGPQLDSRVDASALGAGLGARVGYALRVGPVQVIPEGGATYWSGAALLTPDLGLRVSVGSAVRPGAYAHAVVPLPTPDGPAAGFDAGARVDVSLLPGVHLGAHAGLLHLRGADGPPWVAGLHLTLPL